MRVFFDFNDWWVGYYRGRAHHFVCVIPTLVIRWNRKPPKDTQCQIWESGGVNRSPRRCKLALNHEGDHDMRSQWLKDAMASEGEKR